MSNRTLQDYMTAKMTIKITPMYDDDYSFWIASYDQLEDLEGEGKTPHEALSNLIFIKNDFLAILYKNNCIDNYFDRMGITITDMEG